MATTEEVRQWWSEYRCSYGSPTNMFGRTPVFAQETQHVRALEQVHYEAGYVPIVNGYIGSRRFCPSGIGGKDCQESGKDCSLHNYGIAWDIEYNYNPHIQRPVTRAELAQYNVDGITKYTPEIIDAIHRVTNTEGDQLFQWLGYLIGDFMHFQINVPPWAADVDWTSIGGPMATHYNVGVEDADFEALLWRMAWIGGLRINANGNSAQIEDVFPWHQGVSVRIPMQEDFSKFGEMTSMHQASINKIINNGLYKRGLEVAALDERMYT